jgi:hypothetical protein
MSTDLLCFIVGVILTALWLRGIGKGVMLRIGRRPLSELTPWSPLVRKSDRPVHFWVSTVAVSIFPLGFLLLPVLTWLGLRR